MGHTVPEKNDYALLDLLDRLEELLEEMDELGVTTRAEAEARLAEIESQIADLEPDEA